MDNLSLGLEVFIVFLLVAEVRDITRLSFALRARELYISLGNGIARSRANYCTIVQSPYDCELLRMRRESTERCTTAMIYGVLLCMLQLLVLVNQYV